MPPTPTLADQVQIEEYKNLRGELELRSSEQRTLERYAILADAALYSVLVFPKLDQFTGDRTLYNLAWFLPPLLGLFALRRWKATIFTISDLAEFLRRREEKIYGEEDGWEWFLHNEKRRQKPIVHFAREFAWFWWVCIGGTLALAVWQSCGRNIVLALLVGAVASIVISLWIRSWSPNV
jgi:hypothetical protein